MTTSTAARAVAVVSSIGMKSVAALVPILLVAGCVDRQLDSLSESATGSARHEVIVDRVALDAETTAFLDELQSRTFRWFWETTNPATGLVHDRYPTRHFSSIAAIGFGLTAYGIGAERGYVSRSDAAERTLTTLSFLYGLPQGPQQVGIGGYKGFFYHFLEYGSGERFRVTELSTIDTSLLIAGVLFAREYYSADDETERHIRAYADSMYQRIEWDWFKKSDEVLPTMGWHAETDFGRATWRGYNEAMILYVLGLGSPTFPLAVETWDAWTSSYQWLDFYGYEHVNFSPLFGHQYSHLFVDFKGIQDQYMRDKSAEIGEHFDYFENSRRATLSQRAYAIDNPDGWLDYGSDIWGLTASDGPSGTEREFNGKTHRFRTYSARGASATRIDDDGTIAPTAVGGSIPFAPEVTIPALVAMAEKYGDDLWTEYGFRDAFNPSFRYTDANLKPASEITENGWFDHDYLGIDQGPIIIMAENYRSSFVWDTIKRSPYMVRGLRQAGFAGGWLDSAVVSTYEKIDFPRQPERQDVGENTRLVVVLGSSTAAGVGPKTTSNTWVNRYRRYLQQVDPNFDVLNLARGGYTTYRVLPNGSTSLEDRPVPDTLRNIDAALKRNPVAIVVSLPSNDAAEGFSVQDQLENYDAIVRRAARVDVPVWITTPLPRDLPVDQTQAQIALRDSLDRRYGDRVVDFWTGFGTDDGKQDPRWDSGDRLHYNDDAHTILFERVRDARIQEVLDD